MAALVTLQPASSASPPPRTAWRHLISGTPPLVFLVEGSRLIEVDASLFAALADEDPEAEAALAKAAGIAPSPAAPADDLSLPTALSLNLAQACNLSCSYCYADEGRFGGPAQLMTEQLACSAIDRLIIGARGRSVTIGFIGGEPFLNRRVLHRSVEYALGRGRDCGVRVGFSVTTNGTLLQPGDIDLLRSNSFAVTISVDGSAALNDLHRRNRTGASSFQAALARVEPLLRNPGRARIAARATVTRDSLDVLTRIEALGEAGFTDIGVSPLRTGPDPNITLRRDDWSHFLDRMIEAGEVEFERLEQRRPLRFSNLAIALKQIHRGAARRLPCGAGANYVSLSAQGEYYTCHRTVGDARFALGQELPDIEARRRFVMARDVLEQPECRRCWARYLCGGGCHAEVVQRGREGCDYIRGWLEYCLRFYDRASAIQPDLFENFDGTGRATHEPNLSS